MWEWKCINFKQPCEIAVEQKVFVFPETRTEAVCPSCRQALVRTAQRIQSRGWWSRTLRPLFWLAVVAIMGIGLWWLARPPKPPSPVANWKLAAPPSITGRVGDELAQQITVTPAVNVKFTSDKPLPAGLSLEDNGTIHGKPTAMGDTSVTLSATDAGKNVHSASLTIRIYDATTIVEPHQVVTGMAGKPLSYTIYAAAHPVAFEFKGLPSGLQQDAQGHVTGACPAPLSAAFEVRVKNASDEWSPWERVEVSIAKSDQEFAVKPNQTVQAFVGDDINYEVQSLGAAQAVEVRNQPAGLVADGRWLKGRFDDAVRQSIEVRLRSAAGEWSPWAPVQLDIKINPIQVDLALRALKDAAATLHRLRTAQGVRAHIPIDIQNENQAYAQEIAKVDRQRPGADASLEELRKWHQQNLGYLDQKEAMSKNNIGAQSAKIIDDQKTMAAVPAAALKAAFAGLTGESSSEHDATDVSLLRDNWARLTAADVIADLGAKNLIAVAN